MYARAGNRLCKLQLTVIIMPMEYKNERIAEVAGLLKARLEATEDKAAILKSVELKALYAEIPTLPTDQRASFGKEINLLKSELEALADGQQTDVQALAPIDVTAPFDVNVAATAHPRTLPAAQGSQHPLSQELQTVLDIFYRMGFGAVGSPQLDDDWHMFTSLNFPEDHPARDDYDTFMTVETDRHGKPFIAPAHTSTMQHRVLTAHRGLLEAGQPIAAVIPGRVFRNEDLDARHEHTFIQLEGVYVDKGVHAGHLISTFKTFLEAYYQQEMELKLQPFYFPFTEPSFEFVLSCPFCQKKGCKVCSHSGWIELGGCGMVHPNVLKIANIDPAIYTGFAWGFGIERLVMMKHNIEDIRHFQSGRLDFLRQFS